MQFFNIRQINSQQATPPPTDKIPSTWQISLWYDTGNLNKIFECFFPHTPNVAFLLLNYNTYQDKTEVDTLYNKLCIRDASRVVKQLKICKRRKLGWRHSLAYALSGLLSRNKTLVIAVKKVCKSRDNNFSSHVQFLLDIFT